MLAIYRARRPTTDSCSCLCPAAPAVRRMHCHATQETAQRAAPSCTLPDAYVTRWRTAARPPLEALWSRARTTSNAEGLLLNLDATLGLLRSASSSANHIQQHHVDPAWSAAGASVASECSKLEAYISSDRGITKRLQSLNQWLLQQLQQQSPQPSTRIDKQQQPTQQQQRCDDPTRQHASAAAGVLSLQQQLHLSTVLSQRLLSCTVEDAGQWLAALELPDARMQQLQQLQAQEQALVSAIDSVVRESVPLALPGTPQQLLQEAYQSHPRANSSWDDAADTADTDNNDSRTAAAEDSRTAQARAQVSDPDGHEDSRRQQHFIASVDRTMLARVLQQCPDGDVRLLVHEAVLQPKLQQMARLLAELASCRQHQAELSGHSSYLAATQQRMQPSGGCSHDPVMTAAHSTAEQQQGRGQVDLLLQLQEALMPLCEREQQWISRAAAAARQLEQQQRVQVEGASTPSLHSNKVQQQQQQQQQPTSCASSSSGAASPSTHLLPWDWDHWQHLAQQQFSTALQAEAAVLKQHLQLHGVVPGFSSVLQDLAGLQLSPRTAAADEVWSPHVLVLDVMQQHPQHLHPQQQLCKGSGLLGTVYVDIGGSYGARMLRYARSTAHQGNSDSSKQDSIVPSTPAVAIGIAGTRLEVQQQQQQQQPLLLEAPQQQEPVEAGDVLSPPDATNCVLSVSQLWELGHELGHAVHLVASSRQPACHLSGRFLPPSLLELPPQLMERLMLDETLLGRIARHHASLQPLPAELAGALAAFYGSRYNSALAVSARVAAGLAELMYGVYGGDGEDYWRGAWEAAAGLPADVAAAGSLREVSLLPVMAAHRGTYHCYLMAWVTAAQLYAEVIQPLLQLQQTQPAIDSQQHSAAELQATLRAIFMMHVGSGEAGIRARSSLSAEEVQLWVWQP